MMLRFLRERKHPYLVAAVAVAVTVVLKLALHPLIGSRYPFLFFGAAILLSTWYGGFAPGLFATGLSWVITLVFFLGAFRAEEVLRATTLLFEGLFVSALGGRLHAALVREQRAHAGAAEAESRFERLVKSNIIGLVIGEPNRVVEANDAFASMIGYDRSEILSGEVTRKDITPPEYQALDERAIEQVRRTGRCDSYEKEYIRNDGTRVPVLIGAAAISHEPLRWVAFILDISERRRAEAAHEDVLAREREARAEAERASRTKDDFLAVLSHELRSPISAVLIWTRLLRSREADDATRMRALESIERSVGLQVRLIDDLLDISRIVAGKLSLERTSVELAGLVQASVDLARPAAEERRIELGFAGPRREMVVEGDAARLQQIVGNVLSNAVKFTQEGGRVDVELRRANGIAEIAVVDTGVGIRPDFLPYVFDPFRQADGSITRKHGGLGLGLALARHLAELHGGTIEAASGGEGLGSSFRIRLPVSIAAAWTGPPPGYRPAAPVSSLDGVRVLVVEDDESMRESLVALLTGAGANVDAVSSVELARETLVSRPPDVVVTDLAMPEEDGYALVRELRNGRAGPRLPVIALTALGSAEDRRRVTAAGFDLHLTKPVDPREVLAAVTSAVSGRTREFAAERSTPEAEPEP